MNIIDLIYIIIISLSGLVGIITLHQIEARQLSEDAFNRRVQSAKSTKSKEV